MKRSICISMLKIVIKLNTPTKIAKANTLFSLILQNRTCAFQILREITLNTEPVVFCSPNSQWQHTQGPAVFCKPIGQCWRLTLASAELPVRQSRKPFIIQLELHSPGCTLEVITTAFLCYNVGKNKNIYLIDWCPVKKLSLEPQ